MTWYYKSHTGSELGPVSPLELLDLIRNGTVLRDTWVKKDDSQWVKVEDVNGLMANAAKPSVAYLCPTCGKQISKPPCRCQRCDLHVEKAGQKLVEHDLDEVDRKARKAIAKAKVSQQDPKSFALSRAIRTEDKSASSSVAAAISPQSSARTAHERGGWLSWLRKKRLG